MSKQKQTTFETEKGKYIFQHPGIQFSEKMKDDAKDQNGKFMPHKYYEAIMKNVIVEPAVDYAYFDNLEGDKKETFKPNETEYEFVYPNTKTISEMEYQFFRAQGGTSEVNTKEQFMKHIIKHEGKEVSYDFFDKLGDIEEYNEVIDKASEFFRDTEFREVMNAASRFLRGQEV